MPVKKVRLGPKIFYGLQILMFMAKICLPNICLYKKSSVHVLHIVLIVVLITPANRKLSEAPRSQILASARQMRTYSYQTCRVSNLAYTLRFPFKLTA